MNVEENASTSAHPTATETSAQEENHLRYTSDSYQKILDYRVSEILLTVIFGIILLLRLHR